MTSPDDAPSPTPTSDGSKPISPEDRQRLDPVFMQVVMGVQQEAQGSRPQQAGRLAELFHREQMGDALQGCAMLIAGWNQGRVDGPGMARTARALRGLGLGEWAGRVEGLTRIDEAG